MNDSDSNTDHPEDAPGSQDTAATEAEETRRKVGEDAGAPPGPPDSDEEPEAAADVGEEGAAGKDHGATDEAVPGYEDPGEGDSGDEEPEEDDSEEEEAEDETPLPEFDPDEEPDPQHLRLAEAVLFSATEPLTVPKLAGRLPDGANVPAIMRVLSQAYENRGINLAQAGGRWFFRTAEDLSEQLRVHMTVPRKLSRAAMETLAIVAYHQPVTRAEIEEIRGVGLSRGTMDALLEAGWISPKGRRQTAGRPVTWGTTPAFLTDFGVETIRDLPGLDELKAAGLLDKRPAIQITDTQFGNDDGDDDGEEDDDREEDDDYGIEEDDDRAPEPALDFDRTSGSSSDDPATGLDENDGSEPAAGDEGDDDTDEDEDTAR